MSPEKQILQEAKPVLCQGGLIGNCGVGSELGGEAWSSGSRPIPGARMAQDASNEPGWPYSARGE